MIVLDTNVVSEAMKPSAHPAVLDWLNRQAAETLFLSSVTLAELLFGISAIPTGRRKDALADTLGACRTWGVESENRPQRDQFLPDLQPNSRAIGQKDGKKWAAAADLQPTIRKSDGLLDRLLMELYGGRILPFDADAARCYARLATKARAAGKGFPTPDGYIAAIASAKGFMVATRDTSPFEAAGVPTINPWGAQ